MSKEIVERLEDLKEGNLIKYTYRHKFEAGKSEWNFAKVTGIVSGQDERKRNEAGLTLFLPTDDDYLQVNVCGLFDPNTSDSGGDWSHIITNRKNIGCNFEAIRVERVDPQNVRGYRVSYSNELIQ